MTRLRKRHPFEVLLIACMILPLMIAGCDGVVQQPRDDNPLLPQFPAVGATQAALSTGGTNAASGTTLSLSGQGALNANGVGTIYLSTPAITDDRIDPLAEGPSPSVPGLTSATFSGSYAYGRIGSQTFSKQLSTDMLNAIRAQAQRFQMDQDERNGGGIGGAAIANARAQAQSAPSSAQMEQSLQAAGYEVEVVNETTYRLSKSMTDSEGVTTTYALLTDRNTNEVQSSEVYRNGVLIMQQSNQIASSGQQTVQLTVFPRGEAIGGDVPAPPDYIP